MQFQYHMYKRQAEEVDRRARQQELKNEAFAAREQSKLQNYRELIRSIYNENES